MKQLICLTSPNYIDDFRKYLMADYNMKKQKMIVCQNGPKFANYKPIFDGQYFSKEQCLIFNRGDVSVSASSNLLFKDGYKIDDIGLSNALTTNKLILFDFLKRFQFNVPELSVGVDPQQPYAAKFDYDGRIQMCNSNDTNTDYGIFPWETQEISGMLFYYFLGKRIATASFLQTPHETLLKLNSPVTKYYTLVSDKLYNSTVKPREMELYEKQRVENVKVFNSNLVKAIDAIPSLLNSTSTQVTVGWNGDKPTVLNIQQTHNPFAIGVMGEDSFIEKVKCRFYEVLNQEG